MRLTVVIPDNVIKIDSVALLLDRAAMPKGPPDAIAIQWHGTILQGQIEGGDENGPFRDPAVVKPYVEAWRAEMQRRVEAVTANFDTQVREFTDLLKRQAEERARRDAEAAEIARRNAEREAHAAAHAQESARVAALAEEDAARRRKADIARAAASRAPVERAP